MPLFPLWVRIETERSRAIVEISRAVYVFLTSTPSKANPFSSNLAWLLSRAKSLAWLTLGAGVVGAKCGGKIDFGHIWHSSGYALKVFMSFGLEWAHCEDLAILALILFLKVEK